MNRFVPYSYKDNIARTYYGTVNISYEPASTDKRIHRGAPLLKKALIIKDW